MQIEFIAATDKHYDAVIVGIYSDGSLSKAAKAKDKDLDGLISSAVEKEAGFTGKQGETLSLVVKDKRDLTTLILLGLGDPDAQTSLSMEKAGAKLAAHLQKRKTDTALLDVQNSLSAEQMAAFANGYYLRCYKFDRYKTAAEKKSMQVLYIAGGNDSNEAEKRFKPMKATTEAVHFARDLSNEPPNSLNPTSYAAKIVEQMKKLGVKTKVIDHKALTKMGAGAILAVGQGSPTPPCFVVMEYAGGEKKPTKTKGWDTALVGKGITFDTGGYSLKPPASQVDMKFDMCGSSAVVGAMQALAARQAKINVVGIVALAENMVSDKAYRVNDIVTSLSGKTIEVLNTDAEGRLVLADAMTYIQTHYNPGRMMDLATLTGAALVALGLDYAAAYSTTDELYDKAAQASAKTGEKVWRMPLDEIFDEEMKGQVADLRNIGKGRWAGSCTAAAFLKQFVADEREWAHFDIAGTAYSAKEGAFAPAGGNGYGVRLLVEMLDPATD